MAVGAVTIQDIIRFSNDRALIAGSVVGSSSYVTGGDTGLLAGLGVGQIFTIGWCRTFGYNPEYIVAGDRMKVYMQPGAAAAGAAPELTAATNLSANVFTFLAWVQT